MTKPAEKEGTTKKPNLIELADARRQIIEKVIGCYSGVLSDKIKKEVIDFLSELMKREIIHKAAP